ncbi:sarcoplasmic reticulum histidine-rich calcium-binding protein-like [Vigna unguiculata]|uniref:sarcoplasmic reticulum histidine-rich calcium-binding protein-like n=1 Tax=Vigna unguiculata TaxID=3917 RepID=UPI001015E30E|nr:sarcoplasmic reticulum histidine-rich calcium-binding protein-like [Vigna unguiculata]
MCDDRFEVVVHHGGYFERNEGRWSYSNGLTSTLACDPDRWSFFEIMGILREMGYVNIKDLWYNVSSSEVLENNLKILNDDMGAMQMVRIARRNGQVHMYVNHSICEAEMQQDMEYELEDDADSHHNIRVEPQTEFEETGVDVVVEGDETGADGLGVDKETGVDAEVEGDEAGDDGVGVDKETGVGAEGDEAGGDGVGVNNETGVGAEGDEAGGDGVGVNNETGVGAEGDEAGGDGVGEGDEAEGDEDETGSDLVDVSVHYEDNLWEGNGEEDSEDDDLEFDCSDHVDMRDRGLFDDGWESDEMYSDDPSSDDSLASRTQ